MAIVESGGVTLSFKDFDGDVKQTSFRTAKLTEANVAVELPKMETLATTATALVDGTPTEKTVVWEREYDAIAPKASSNSIQTRRQWRLVFQDTVTTREFTMTLATAKNENALFKPNSTEADLTEARWVAFKAAAQAVMKSPEGNPVLFVNAYMID